jgi:lipopolysaccharide export system protein LptC
MSAAQAGVLVALCLALLLTAWLQQQLQLDQQPARMADTPDYYLERFASVAYDSQGLPSTWLEAAQLAHYPSDGSFRLVAPRMRWRKPGEPVWQVRAATGWADAAGHQVELQGAVTLARETVRASDTFSLSTEQLSLWPKEERLASASAVVLRQGDNHQIAAVGLRAGLRKPAHIEFLSQVRTQYVAH